MRRTEETAAGFQAQDVANTLWALATISKMKGPECKRGFSSAERVIGLGEQVLERVLGLLDWRNFATSLVLLPLAPIGVWMGVRLARRIQPDLFYRLIRLGMFLTGCKLLWDGWR